MGRGFLSWVKLLLPLLALGGKAAFAAPRIAALYPAGGQRGTTVRVTVSGEGLKDLKGFFALGTGLRATLLPGGDNATRTAEIAIAADAPTGIQTVRFFDEAGLSNPRYFQVGTLPETLEKEPNNEIAGAPMVALPVTVNGRIAENPDRDGVTFHARAGETIVCEIQGLRVLGQVGDSWLKGYLEIVDAKGRILASSEGTSDEYYRWDPLILFAPKEEGDYTAFFRDLNWRGDLRSVYRLTLGAVPHATGILPLGGRRGSAAMVTACGANLGGALPLTIPDDAPETLSIAPGGALNARPFQTSDLPETAQTDASRTREPGQRVAFPAVVNGQFSERGMDFYRFALAEKAMVALEVFSRRLGTPADPEIALYDAKGGLMNADDDSRGRDGWIVRELPAGEYVVAVRDVDERGGPAFGYRLFLAPPRPRLAARALPDAPSLTRGGTVALSVHIDREHWDEEVTVTLENPPPGVSAAPATIPKGKQDGTLTLQANAEAPLGPVRLRVVATANRPALRALARTEETYNIQGTAFQRELVGPIAFVVAK